MLAQGSLKPISISIVPVIISLIIGYLIWVPSYYLSILFLIIIVLIIIFFRDPDRKIGEGIVSSADGKVVLVNKETNRIDVFMNITDVHVNRAPVSGRVKDTRWIEGEFKPAFLDESRDNFRHVITLDSGRGEIKIHQITGFLARRIVPYIKKGDKLEKGERIGLIRFGSRVRLDLPSNVKIIVNKGERVRAGKSTIGVWNED